MLKQGASQEESEVPKLVIAGRDVVASRNPKP